MQGQYKFMTVIVDEGMCGDLRAILSEYQGMPKASSQAYGMTKTEILQMLGFPSNRKVMTFFGLDRSLVGGFYIQLEKRLSISENGNGVAFTIPVSAASGCCGKLMQYMVIRKKSKGADMVEQKFQHTHELIVTIVTKGEAEKVKQAAEKSGAKGGTMIQGFGLGGEEAAKLLGMSIQAEKDVVLIVADCSDREAIMKAIVDECGIETAARGICFSLPVDSAAGLR